MYKTPIRPDSIFIGTIRPCYNTIGLIKTPVPYIDYNDNYEIVPRSVDQILETRDKHILDDFRVRRISCYDLINDDGGETCFIGHDALYNTSSVVAIAISGLAVVGRRIIN